MRLLISTLIGLGLGACAATTAPTTTTFYLARHAEKMLNAGDDPSLTSQGQQRAAALAVALADAPLQAIFVTEFRRTQETAAPAASVHGIAPTIIPADALDETIEQLLARHLGERVLVVGHSNTIPELIERLGVTEVVAIADDAYGDLFVVTRDTAGQATLARRRFGN